MSAVARLLRRAGGRWAARPALASGAALLVPLVFAGPRSVAPVGAGPAGLAAAAAGVWWVPARRRTRPGRRACRSIRSVPRGGPF
jgi:hypothetical protein